MSHTHTTVPSSSPTGPSGTPRWVWVLLIMLVAIIIGGTAGLLAYATDSSVPSAILTGGSAFAGAVALLLGIAHFMGGSN